MAGRRDEVTTDEIIRERENSILEHFGAHKSLVVVVYGCLLTRLFAVSVPFPVSMTHIGSASIRR